MLTALSLHWFALTGDIVAQPRDLGDGSRTSPRARAIPSSPGASLLVRRLEMLPLECVVRGYLAGSGWKDYGRTRRGLRHPAARRACARPTGCRSTLFTPSTKATERPRREHHAPTQGIELVGEQRYRELERASIALYERAAAAALERGIILADTKFEFGIDGDGALVLGDEVLTPDSSRFWPADSYAPGSSPPSFDKQYVRDWLETQDWDKTAARARAARRRARRHGRALPRGLRATRRTPVRELPRRDGGARVKVTVLVRPKEGILDPQGEAIRQALTTLGYPASSVRAGPRVRRRARRRATPPRPSASAARRPTACSRTA